MRLKLLDVLACPKCQRSLTCRVDEHGKDGEITAGILSCEGCGQEYPITAGIPRFVALDNYAASFGYQWNRFKSEQIDSVNGTKLSAKRFYSETGWTKEWLQDKWILDAGCGAGRFIDVASDSGAEVVGLDISNAIDAAKANLAGRNNVHFVQASIYEPPFLDAAFDGLYCIGVIQHTPDPPAALRALPKSLKKAGRIAVTIYERKPWTPLYGKYLIRPLTKLLKDKTLLRAIRGLMPVLFPITEIAFRIPVAGKLFMFTIPVANYVHERDLSVRDRYRWAVLDTFDMLSPRYDQPQTQNEVEAALQSGGVVNLKRLANPGVNVVGEKG